MTFAGFADTQGKFFKQLAKNNDAEWFRPRKEEFEAGWRDPMKALLSEVRDKLEPAYPDCFLADPKIFRLNRDVRFSTDKAPYKTSVSGLLMARPHNKEREGVTEVPAALYFQIGSEDIAACGQYGMSGPGLQRYRAALLDEKRGAELHKIVKSLEKAGYTLGAMETLKKAPRGIDPDHPRVELLKRKGLMVSLPKVPRALWTSKELVKNLVASAKKAAPLVRWLVHEVV
jgi:uncharacterized protein (TIGR02453 family)